MGNWNLGSVATDVLVLVPDTPSSISGAPLERITYQSVIFAEQYLQTSIGSVDILDKFQPALVNLTAASVIRSQESQNADLDNIKFDVFSFTTAKGGESSKSQIFYKMGIDALKAVGRKQGFVKVLG